MALPSHSGLTAHSLVKRLVAAGGGARRRAATVIMSGAVLVNGHSALDLNLPVSVEDVITVNGAPIASPEHRRVYLLLNKPKGYLSAVTDARGRPTVLDLVPSPLRAVGLVPAGRLDLESTGLVFLTNDGELVNRITHPRYGVEKEYDVLLDRGLSDRDVRQLLAGVEIEDGMATAVSVSRGKRNQSRCQVVLIEGKKRQVRLMMRVLGRRVLSLNRVRIADFRLGKLEPGAVAELSLAEVKRALNRGQRGPRRG